MDAVDPVDAAAESGAAAAEVIDVDEQAPEL
jgi:hypothetical protein